MKLETVNKLEQCRLCKSRDLYEFISLGPIPLPNAFLKEEQLSLPESYYPLDVCFCRNCGMVQLSQVVEPSVMFKEYAYFTGTSDQMVTHFWELANTVIDKLDLPEGSLIADIGSNDGTLLRHFKDRSMRVIGIDPAENVAKLANNNGIDTIADYFGMDMVEKLRSNKGQPMVITATNVFAHVHDLDDFMRGICYWLDNKGVFIIEVPYLVEMIKKVEFDTIYHEHLSYFSVSPLVRYFKSLGMRVIDVERISVHGGSIRVYVSKDMGKSSINVENLLKQEDELGLDNLETYILFAKSVIKIRSKLLTMLKEIKDNKKTIVGYGAAAKGNILLNYCKIGTDIIDCIYDSTPYKHGLFNPGMHIPVLPFDKFYADPPDYTLLLIWNYLDSILKKESRYIASRGKFIIPIPIPYIKV